MTDDPRGRLVDGGRWLFGDRQGLVLWLGLVCWFGLAWRVGFFIQDTYAVANTLVALADGQLHVTELRYSLTLGSQPGLHEHAGRFYGRNYGQLALAVPLVWVLEGLSTVVAPRVLLAGLWAGVGLALVTQLSEFERFDRGRTRAVGAAVVTLLFVASVLTATALPTDRLALVALQLSTLLVAATAGLVVYRLFALLHGRRVGLAAGVALGVATPVGFWATLPKRHTIVATLVLGAVYAFAVSRHREGDAALRARAGAYALAGYITWVHAFEALFVVAVLGVVDLLTTRDYSVRSLLVVGLVLLVASTPMLATNYAISGNPAKPPRLLSPVDSDAEFSPPPDDTSGGEGGNDTTVGGNGSSDSAGGGGPGGGQPAPPLVDVARDAVGTVSTFAGESVGGGLAVLSEPDRLWHIFVRSGTIPSVSYGNNDYEPIDLTVLEAMPILGALAALPALAGRRARRLVDGPLGALDPRAWRPARQTDLLVVTLAAVLTLVYLPRLPLYSMLTVRYLHPAIALSAYGVCRIPAVRAGLSRSRWLAGSFLAGLVAALVVLLGGIVGLELAVGEAVQYSALWQLAAATGCAVVTVGRTVTDRVPDRAVTVAVAVSAGFTAAYLLLSALVYFRYGSYAFDLVALVADALPAL
ncbi:hypothetical protein NDI56_19450 [Haloarcula sp. S1CR25-12]|uniref:Glycosyltransferase RgtA/B/C/D-like domain-containing protein n=1 Tax=Haloarcula saliterrae TaxID=2950534 RepID=A0ABU2FH60_9EURY|nr:hypothetical protein [Haloarcula sp. S1CR25-12]MDS0261581.1 hypothetical protein [Haloarcula sp. S1CR25-12]